MLRVVIGRIGNGRGFSAYRPDFVGEVGNFTDFLPTRFISTVTITGNWWRYPVTVTGRQSVRGLQKKERDENETLCC